MPTTIRRRAPRARTPQIIRADAREIPLKDASVDCIVTSPPYFGLRSYTDAGEPLAGQVGAEADPAKFIEALIDCTREMRRVLKPTGSIFVNLGDRYAAGGGAQGKTGQRADRAQAKTMSRRQSDVAGYPPKSLLGLPWHYALRCVGHLGLVLRAEIIWSKTNPMPESVHDRVRRSHETWFHFTKTGEYYSCLDEIREEYAPGTAARYALGYNPRDVDAQRPTVNTKLGGDTYAQNPAGKLPGSVWSIPSQPLKVPAELNVQHFAAFPMEWPKRFIKGWCPPRGVVLDPFGGTGTTALVACALGRQGISLDLSADYCRLATWRASEPKQLAKAAS